MESVRAASWEHGGAYCLISIIRRWCKRKGNKRKAVNNKTYLYPQNSTFGLGTIKSAIESKRDDIGYFFMSIHRSALPRV